MGITPSPVSVHTFPGEGRGLAAGRGMCRAPVAPGGYLAPAFAGEEVSLVSTPFSVRAGERMTRIKRTTR